MGQQTAPTPPIRIARNMRRQTLFVQPDGAASTFANDDHLPALPLPALDATLDRYYASLVPFASHPDELRESRARIERFRHGVGPQLHRLVEQRAAEQRNWVERWWEDYAYCADRTPLLPYANMHGTYMGEQSGWLQTPEMRLKNMARIIHCTAEYWDLIRSGRLRPSTNPSGSVTFTAFMLKRLFSTNRTPGTPIDRIDCHFRTLPEATPTHVVAIGRGRFFMFDVLDRRTGRLKRPVDLLPLLEQIDARLALAAEHPHPVAVLTAGERSAWADQRRRIVELSAANARTIELVETAIFVMSLDEHEPDGYAETCQRNMCGDLQSRWADKSCQFIVYRNGRFGCSGEHGCYDGTISVGLMVFTMMSMLDGEEPDWAAERPTVADVPVELEFELDAELRADIERTVRKVDVDKYDVLTDCSPFIGYGKAFLKEHRLHPDSYIQSIIQLVYFRLHNEFVATYETALMANYYNGRTETLRSCSTAATAWVRTFEASTATDAERMAALRTAVQRHNELMGEARSGRGIDRHLFGLWCAAFEADLPIPDLYDDPLYKRSGGGGNFVLSTSTLGYSLVCGYVAPMCRDGYGLFYSITDEVIFLHVLSMRASEKTSAARFNATFERTMREVRDLIERTAAAGAKL